MAGAEPLVGITDQRIDPRAVEESVWTSADGAMVTFSGVVRDHDGGRGGVLDIEYSSHPASTDMLARLCGEVAEGHSARVAAVHRVGVLPVGELAVVVVAVSAHRAEAFAACSDLIERLKGEIPIWKRQRFADGVTEWVGVGDC